MEKMYPIAGNNNTEYTHVRVSLYDYRDTINKQTNYILSVAPVTIKNGWVRQYVMSGYRHTAFSCPRKSKKNTELAEEAAAEYIDIMMDKLEEDYGFKIERYFKHD